MAKAKTELENYLVYGVDELNRRVFFGADLLSTDPDDIGEFTHCSCEYAIRAIERMIADHPKTPIEIHMTSYGGSVDAMLGLYDIIQSSTCQIKFIGRGVIMSAASFIMAGCDERSLYPHTRVLVHEISMGDMSGKYTDLGIEKEELDLIQEDLYCIYTNNSRMPKDFWKEVCKRDLIVSAEEAIQLGLADKIIHPKKRGNYRKARQHHLSQSVNKNKMNALVKKLLKRIHASPKKMEITLNTPKIEPVDEKLVIEPIQKIEEKPETKED